MKLMHHGGLCCGVKTVYGLSSDPEYLTTAIKEVTTIPCDGGSGSIGVPWYRAARPAESAANRLLEYIRFYKTQRTSGILELVIQTPREPSLEYNSLGQARWIPWLLEQGFVEVNAWINSNSSNVCRQFVLNIGDAVTINPVIPAADWWAHYDPKGKYQG